MNHALIGQIAGIMALVQVIPYVVSILRGHTKPERTTYFIWLILNVVTTTSYIAVGARTTIWTGIAYVFTALLIFGLSIKYGMGGFSRFDIVCFLLAMAGIMMWLSTRNALLTLYFGMLVSFIAYLPTIKKAYFLPETENTLSWVMTTCTALVNICALTTLKPSIALGPILGVFTAGTVTYLLLFPVAHAKIITHRKKNQKIHMFFNHSMFAK
jgi:hypothetical protein